MTTKKIKPKNLYLVAIKLDIARQNIYATISEVLTHDFVGVFSIAKQENIQFRDLLKINPESYFSENLNPIKLYEAKLDKVKSEDYLKRLTNSIYLWEEKGKNKIKLIEKYLNGGTKKKDKRFCYSIIKESKFHGKNISSFLFSDKSEFSEYRPEDSWEDFKILPRNYDEDFSYYSKIIYTEDLSPHLILNFGIYNGNLFNFEILQQKMTREEISNLNARKKLSEIVEEKYDWEVNDENDLTFFMDIIQDLDLYDRLNKNSYNKWLNYRNLIGLGKDEQLDKHIFYDYFDIEDFILFFLSEDEDLEKIIKSPHYCTKKKRCQFCFSMTHKDLDVCYHCTYNEKLNIFNKINENLKSTALKTYYILILKYKELKNIHEEIKYYKIRRSYEYKKAQKWYKLNRVNKEKFNNKSKNQKQIDYLKTKIDHNKKLLESFKKILSQKGPFEYLKTNLKEVVKII